ncbi:MAG TPA: DUF58 domain-containing protein [Methylocella sp.]|nr:DUF58 domain-containing protein [Methylocella sp.]
MVAVWSLDRSESRTSRRHQNSALELASRFPGLCAAARETAASVMHGVHGRRRAGSGENFWQFRPFIAGEAANRIDWRRSAKDDRLYVREREWEAAHTVFVWIDRSPSMWFSSNLALQPKIDRALVLGLAAADLLVRSGERVGLLGLTAALAVRHIIERFAEVLLAQELSATYVPQELPREANLPRGAQVILIGDFLSDEARIVEAVGNLAGRGARGHIVVLADPAEEAFPFTGNTEFVDSDSPARLRIGQAESLREEYRQRLALHREFIASAARAKGWSFMLHNTDRPATQALLTLQARLDAAAHSSFLPRPG